MHIKITFTQYCVRQEQVFVNHLIVKQLRQNVNFKVCLNILVTYFYVSDATLSNLNAGAFLYNQGSFAFISPLHSLLALKTMFKSS